MNTDNIQTATDLYRFYAADGTLLYIGISKSAIARMVQHATEKSWWDEVANVQIERVAGYRRDALYAEALAIYNEQPKYNMTGKALPPLDPNNKFGFRSEVQIDKEQLREEIALNIEKLNTKRRLRIQECRHEIEGLVKVIKSRMFERRERLKEITKLETQIAEATKTAAEYRQGLRDQYL